MRQRAFGAGEIDQHIGTAQCGPPGSAVNLTSPAPGTSAAAEVLSSGLPSVFQRRVHHSHQPGVTVSGIRVRPIRPCSGTANGDFADHAQSFFGSIGAGLSWRRSGGCRHRAFFPASAGAATGDIAGDKTFQRRHHAAFESGDTSPSKVTVNIYPPPACRRGTAGTGNPSAAVEHVGQHRRAKHKANLRPGHAGFELGNHVFGNVVTLLDIQFVNLKRR